ncbi:MAG: IS3 family transposase [Desulfobacteraceae bacterium]|nr:IS3 family transposase [Desulfobacteraceae bacterium]
MKYSNKFKSAMIHRLSGNNAISANALSQEVGVGQTTLSKWLRDGSVIQPETFQEPAEEFLKEIAYNMTKTPKRPKDWSPEQKMQAVLDASQLSDDDLGGFLRKKGLHESDLKQWRIEMLGGLQGSKSKKKTKGKSAEAKRIRQLEKEVNRKDKALAETAALLVLKKKGPGDLGGRGRRHPPEERKMILDLIDEAIESGARLSPAAEIIGLSARTIIRWRSSINCLDKRNGPNRVPSNKLCAQERQTVLKIANSPECRDLSPNQIVPKLADMGIYLASESTFYRILRDEKLINHREPSKPASSPRPREHVATGPCQVWSWDITYLKTDVKGIFLYLYMIMDVWSRKIVAAQVFEEECMEHSSILFAQACMRHGVKKDQLVLHADNGGPMKGSTMLATLHTLGVTPSFSRPRVSNDNPFSESLFRTMKYRPEYPSKPFSSIEEAQLWVDGFVHWYNSEHLHSSIRFVTPDDRHSGREDQILSERHRVYEEAKKRMPNRWSGSTRNWKPDKFVWLNPEKSSDNADVMLQAA